MTPKREEKNPFGGKMEKEDGEPRQKGSGRREICGKKKNK